MNHIWLQIFPSVYKENSSDFPEHLIPIFTVADSIVPLYQCKKTVMTKQSTIQCIFTSTASRVI